MISSLKTNREVLAVQLCKVIVGQIQHSALPFVFECAFWDVLELVVAEIHCNKFRQFLKLIENKNKLINPDNKKITRYKVNNYLIYTYN